MSLAFAISTSVTFGLVLGLGISFLPFSPKVANFHGS